MVYANAETITIAKARFSDLAEILRLQKNAFLSEARLLHDYDIQPLQQTLTELEKEFEECLILKAVNFEDVIVGSVRGREKDGTVYIGKLVVYPECRGQGLGTRLLNAIEDCFPDKRYELFTSDASANNLRLYERNGYRECRKTDTTLGFKLVYMEKGV